MTKRIHLISGPRNISTAMMYAWANRADTQVVDEPLYAYYLKTTGIDYHPGIPETMAAMPSDFDEVLTKSIFQNVDADIYFIKGMAHHIVDCGLEFLLQLENVFLIRNPKQLITSFAKVIKYPTMTDIGLKKEWELFQHLKDAGQPPIVLDSNTVLSDPLDVLSKLCNRLDVPFDNAMLSWEPGPIAEDGPWAKYWYQNVWASTGWGPPDTRERELPKHLFPLYEEALEYYQLLKRAAV